MTVRNLMMGFVLAVGAILLPAQPCQAQETPPRPGDATRTYQVFLLGNTGSPSPGDLGSTLEVLRRKLEAAGQNSAVVFLGDQLYGGGMPDSGAVGRAEAERHLMPLLEAVKDHPGKVLFIPGDKDWGKADQGGWKALTRQETFIEQYLDRGNVFVPDNGFPGPHEVRLTRDIRLIALNTEWLLTEGPRATGEAKDYDAEEEGDVYVALQDLIRKRSNRDLIIVGHHPLYSNGRYGGHYPGSAHLFPLTTVWQDAYVPLPVLGTLFLSFRRNIGSEEHFSHARNAWMRHALESILIEHEDFVYASAHDFSLQHFETKALNFAQDFIVSGSAARSEHVAEGHDAEFTSREKGLVALSYYSDGSVWMDIWAAEEGGVGRLLYEKNLREPSLATAEPEVLTDGADYPDYTDSTIVIVPEPGYEAGALHRFLLGSNHRDIWTMPIEVPYIDLGKEAGGLTPIKRGGGLQSISIRMQGADGKQYVLRSINKNRARALQEELRNSVVAPIVQDMLSYSHPLGAFIIPKLADAVGVYHTNPRLVYVPSDPRLGSYRGLVGGTLMLFEERPDDDMSSAPSFGNAPDVIGTPEMFRNVTRDNDDRVDQRALARARLFDLWLSDWDRHKDQWRWAVFDDPDGKGDLYRPIPRDRDQAFSLFDLGLAPLVRPFLQIQGFRKSYGTISALATKGMELDHQFLNELDRDDWREIAERMQTGLTDAVIDDAMRDWPEPVFAHHGEQMIEIGKVRRDHLPEAADAFYRIHARTVDVVGSNKHERFEVTRLGEDQTQVVVYKTSKDGEILQEIYRRTFRRKDTREINLYGLGGNDQFVVTGQVRKAIKVHAVGGTGHDSFVDQSSGKKIHFYDSEDEQNTWQPAPKTAIHQSNNPQDNTYVRVFQFDRTYPLALPSYNSDDGLILIGGAIQFKQGFQKTPFARQHLVLMSFATERQAFGFQYTGRFTSVFGDWDLGLRADVFGKENVTNFFGLGNETEDNGGNIGIFRTRLGRSSFAVPLLRTYESGLALEIAPKLEIAQLDEEETELLALRQAGLSEPTSDSQWYTGLSSGITFSYKDDLDNPRQGYAWSADLDLNLGVRNAPDHYATLASALTLYTSLPTERQVTLALRVGGAHNIGTFPYYGANTLGGKLNLRGFRSTRFSGRSSFYTNAELRMDLFSLKSNILPGRLGLLGFLDNGRVWTDEESSRTWHQGYGTGLWYNAVDQFILWFTAGQSVEGTYVLGGVGFFF